MKEAYISREEYSKDGKCLKRERIIGASVPRAIVALAALVAGSAFVGMPPFFWNFLKFLK